MDSTLILNTALITFITSFDIVALIALIVYAVVARLVIALVDTAFAPNTQTTYTRTIV